MRYAKAQNLLRSRFTSDWLKAIDSGVLLVDDLQILIKNLNDIQHSYEINDVALPLLESFVKRGLTVQSNDLVDLLTIPLMNRSCFVKVLGMFPINIREFVLELESAERDVSNVMKQRIGHWLSMKMDDNEEKMDIAKMVNDPSLAIQFMKPYSTIQFGDERHQFILTLPADVVRLSESLQYMLPIDSNMSLNVAMQAMDFQSITADLFPDELRNKMIAAEYRHKVRGVKGSDYHKLMMEVFADDPEFVIALGGEINYYTLQLEDLSVDARRDLFSRPDVPVWFSNKNAGAMIHTMLSNTNNGERLQRLIDFASLRG